VYQPRLGICVTKAAGKGSTIGRLGEERGGVYREADRWGRVYYEGTTNFAVFPWKEGNRPPLPPRTCKQLGGRSASLCPMRETNRGEMGVDTSKGGDWSGGLQRVCRGGDERGRGSFLLGWFCG